MHRRQESCGKGFRVEVLGVVEGSGFRFRSESCRLTEDVKHGGGFGGEVLWLGAGVYTNLGEFWGVSGIRRVQGSGFRALGCRCIVYG